MKTNTRVLSILLFSTLAVGVASTAAAHHSFAALYEDQPTWQESIAYLGDRGFSPAGIYPVVRDENWSLIEGDCVLVRDPIR